MGLDQQMKTRICHYCITQSSFSAPEILFSACLSFLPPALPLTTTNLFTMSIILPFPKCRRVESCCV